MNRQGLIYTVVFSFLVTFVFVLVLAVANEGTAEQVRLVQQTREAVAILSAFNIDFTEDNALEIYEEDLQREELSDGTILFRYTGPDGEVVGKRFTGSGLWGEIQGVLAVRADFSQIVGLQIVSHNETPGLGGRIDETWFTEQFRGERIPEDLAITRTPNPGDGDEDNSNGMFDAVTGASRTSDAIEQIVTEELQTLQSLVGGRA